MRSNRILAVAVVVLAMLAVSAPVQGQGGQPNWRDSIATMVGNYLGQYLNGQQSQAQSGVADFLMNLARGVVAPVGAGGQPQFGPGGWPSGAAGQDLTALFGSVMNDATTRYGQDVVYGLFGPAMGQALGQLGPQSREYQNLSSLMQQWYLTGGVTRDWITRGFVPPPRPWSFARCMIRGQEVLLQTDGAVVSLNGGPSGRQIASTNPNCLHTLQGPSGAVYCVATNGYVWSVQPQYPQPVGLCQSLQ